jgi:hypothetical protein
MESIFNALAEFFGSVSDKKAHWYRVFNPTEDEVDCTVMKATFPSLATLMLMDKCYIIELFLHLGLVKWRSNRTCGYIIYPSSKTTNIYLERSIGSISFSCPRVSQCHCSSLLNFSVFISYLFFN